MPRKNFVAIGIGDKLGYETGHIYKFLNEECEVYDASRIFHEDLVKFRKLPFSSQHFDDISVYYQS